MQRLRIGVRAGGKYIFLDSNSTTRQDFTLRSVSEKLRSFRYQVLCVSLSMYVENKTTNPFSSFNTPSAKTFSCSKSA